MENSLKKIVTLQKEGKPIGIYSLCSANRYVIEAAIDLAKKDNSPVLIESTANQVNNDGGYTGMTPKDFKKFVEDICVARGFDSNKVFLGGDHLGPLTYVNLNEEEAMAKAAELIRAYVLAGFSKIHVDTSMKVADDDPNTRLSDEVIARRGAFLVKNAEEAYKQYKSKNPNAPEIVYVVGSEVPIPGGAISKNSSTLEVTRPEDLEASIKTFKEEFDKQGISDVFDRVIAFVVQPGIEEQDNGCVDYDRNKAKDLMNELNKYPNIVFEGHSSDYQSKDKLKELVEDGVAILKVGPAVTFALREGLYALSFIEKELIKDETKRSNFIKVLDDVMLENPNKWASYYKGTPEEIGFKRKYSFSDRCRYYIPNKKVDDAINTLIKNLSDKPIPLTLISQYMPIAYTRIREGKLENTPVELLKDRIRNCIDEYLYATKQNELFK